MLKYDEALSLYKTTDLSVAEICRQTNTPLKAFKAYLQRSHRDLLLSRYGIIVSPEEAEQTRLRKSKGQSPQSYAKYKDVIAACSNPEYFEYNISEIARIFHVTAGGLSQQLRRHFPDIMEFREAERQRLGLSDKFRRGSQKRCREQYVQAIEHLRNCDDTIPHTAYIFNLSYSGLREHLLNYHKDLVEKREGKRKKATGVKKIGSLTGNGTKHIPADEQVKKYEIAVNLYRSTALTMKEIANKTGITINGFKNYLRMWHPELMLKRRGIIVDKDDDITEAFKNSKQYLKSTAAKYAEAIEFLKNNSLTTAEAAKRFNLHPDIFREYLREHEPELAATHGMKRLDNGRLVLARSAQKYSEAIEIYATSSESLKSISGRLNIPYNSLNGFVARNYPEVIAMHHKIVEDELARKREEDKKDEMTKASLKKENERNSIKAALKETNNNRRNAAKLLGISKSTLYKKLHEYKIL